MVVLIIDSSMLIIERMQQVLSEAGNISAIYGASSYKEGIKYFKEKNPDIVLLDIILPDNESLKLLKEMKKEKSDINIILLSSYSDSYILAQFKAVGIDFFYDKYSEFPKIPGAINSIVANKKNNIQKKNNKQYIRTIKGLTDAIFICDEMGYIKMYNLAAAILWGREAKIGTDMYCGSLKIVDDNGNTLPQEKYPMAITLKEGKFIYDTEIIIQRPDGNFRNILHSSSPMFNADGKFIGAVNMQIDITENEDIKMNLRNQKMVRF
jgi:CheY-like chemotaxis protein